MSPRTNPFANRTPATPAAEQPAAAPEAAAPAAPKKATPEKKPATKYPPKVTFYQGQEDTARMRGAYRHTNTEEGDASLSEFIHKAVMAEVERREKKYNGGNEFPDIGVPRGRPMGQ
ncbi:hypothetical protein Bra3105_18335 (plasmid) [Brachybacterium halotolerans subsp. kimchii]|uniref:ParB family protein n=1 Tax=Brachybacterium halotolerans TaxID=2795215 RepID=UPI001E3914EF|nr:hypothetical protein [Brachybacterium halotolerans]UEJ84624.1 hypothetical protein Bra3105_18335 [Brachybacterium halotolerans subsp. kimchii]